MTDGELAGMMAALVRDDVKALHWIAENSDIIIAADRTWLLTPAPRWLLDVLAAVGANLDDRERDSDRENEHDDDGHDETDLCADDCGEAMTWSPPVWPREGEIQVPYHAI
jgi:hypothetical protein